MPWLDTVNSSVGTGGGRSKGNADLGKVGANAGGKQSERQVIVKNLAARKSIGSAAGDPLAPFTIRGACANGAPFRNIGNPAGER
jgi:hypothetical protein